MTIRFAAIVALLLLVSHYKPESQLSQINARGALEANGRSGG